MKNKTKRKLNITHLLISILVILVIALGIVLGYLVYQKINADKPNEIQEIIQPTITPNTNLKYSLGKGKYANEIIDYGFEEINNNGIISLKLNGDILLINSAIFTEDEAKIITQKFINEIKNQKEIYGNLTDNESFNNELSNFYSFFDKTSFDYENITLIHTNSENLPLSVSIPYNSSSAFLSFLFKNKNFIADPIDVPEVKEAPALTYNPDLPMVALTFDDGPSRENTLEIVEKLKEYGAHATFFMLGSKVKGKEDILNEVLASDSEIAGHSWDHPFLTKVDDNELEKQYNWVKDVIMEATGYEIKIFRPPYGDVNDHVKAMSPYPLIHWDIDTLDWKTKNAQKTIENVQQNLKDGSIILMHDIHKPSKEAALKLIPMLIEEGYQLVTVSELFEAKGKTLENGVVYYNAR